MNFNVLISCFCTPNGLKACTKKMCVTRPLPKEEKPVAKRSFKECEPGTKWNDECIS